jgi:peroxiredoxin Q/BCP
MAEGRAEHHTGDTSDGPVAAPDATTVPARLRRGNIAPDFELAGTGDRRYRLSEYRGRPVVLVFYPGDSTPVCTVQLNTYTRDFSQFSGLGAQVLALSPQTVESHEAFAVSQGGFAFPLLADRDKEVGRAYGILGPLGSYRRSVFIIDGAGVIAYAHRSAAGLTYRPVSELVAVLAEL